MRNRGPVFGREQSFEEAFPTVADVRIEVYQGPMAASADEERRQVLGRDQVGEFVACANPACREGRVWIGTLLHDLVREGKTEGESSAVCQALEGSSRSRSGRRQCFYISRVKATITYK